MGRTISLDEFPRKVERLLRSVWEEQESIILERNGEPVATVAPVERQIRKARNGRRKAKTKSPEPSLAYELPADLLAEYHRLLDKKFGEGLTPEDEAEFDRIGKALDKADIETLLGQAILTQAQEKHEQWMQRMDKVIETLRTLKESS